MKVIYFSLIYFHILYGIIFWSYASKTERNKVFIIQKKIIRIISNSNRLDHLELLFKRLNILQLYDLRRFEMSKFVYEDLFYEKQFNFTSRNSVHTHGTRNSQLLAYPHPRFNILLNSVFYQRLKIFKEIPAAIRSAD